MNKYINKEAVMNLIEHNDKVCHYADERYEKVVYATTKTLCQVVAEMPSADVQEEIETLKAQLRDRDKQYNKLMDYVKTSICPTCDNCCSLCPVLESNFVQCCCYGESVPLLTAHTDLNGDYICSQCEEEGAE